jgi:hypothetical protein
MKLSKELAKQAKKFKICREWYDELKSLDNKKAMVAMYVKGIDFCLSNDYPSNEFIRANFKGVMEEYGVFLDDDVALTNVERCVALGKVKGCVEINGFNVCEVFAKHNSELTVVAKGNAFVMIDMFDDAVISVCAEDRSRVCVNRYGGTLMTSAVKPDDRAVVKVIEKCRR